MSTTVTMSPRRDSTPRMEDGCPGHAGDGRDEHDLPQRRQRQTVLFVSQPEGQALGAVGEAHAVAAARRHSPGAALVTMAPRRSLEAALTTREVDPCPLCLPVAEPALDEGVVCRRSP